MKETELAEKFIEYFGDAEIYKEVPGSGIIDFIVVMKPIIISVEVKLSLNFDVIWQAYKNIAYANYSYIAVPYTHKKSFAYKVCRDYGIGVLTYNKNSLSENIHESVKPRLNRSIYKLKLKPYMMRSVAGSQNERMTPFKNTIENMVTYIRRHPDCSLSDCLNNIEYHWGSFSGAKSCVYAWIRDGVIKEFRIENGKLFLNQKNST